VILSVIVILVGLEKTSRRRSRFATSARNVRPVTPAQLRGAGAVAATLACVLPVLAGFVLPVAVLTSHALTAAQWTAPGLAEAFGRTLLVCGLAAVLAVIGGVFMVYGTRLSGRRLPQLLLPVTALGYAAPGAVLALGRRARRPVDRRAG
jgi:iron(III) transport system permease protein